MTSKELNALAEMELEMAVYFWERGHDESADYCQRRAAFLHAKASSVAALAQETQP